MNEALNLWVCVFNTKVLFSLIWWLHKTLLLMMMLKKNCWVTWVTATFFGVLFKWGTSELMEKLWWYFAKMQIYWVETWDLVVGMLFIFYFIVFIWYEDDVLLISYTLFITPSVPLCLSSIPFWDVPKYCPVSKNKSH